MLTDDRSKIDFFDETLTENGRSSYPLSFIDDRVQSGEGESSNNQRGPLDADRRETGAGSLLHP